jgi:hypothetical protein
MNSEENISLKKEKKHEKLNYGRHPFVEFYLLHKYMELLFVQQIEFYEYTNKKLVIL